jgi:general secretion pathway protein L
MNLNESIDFDIKRFFLWWGKELAFWIPEKLRQFLSDKSGYVFMLVTAETIKIVQSNEEHKKTLVELPFNEQGLTQCHKLLEDNTELNKAHLILRLSSEQAIKKTIYLPAAVAKENIKQVVAFEMNKYTPFSSEQVYFALRSQGKEENGQIKVLIVLTPKEILDAIYLQLNGAEIYPDVVDYEDVPNNFDQDLETYNLLPEWERPVKNKIVQTVSWLLSAVLLILVIAVLVFPVWHESQTVDSLKQQIKALEKDTQFIQAQQLEIDEIIDETEQLNKVKTSSPAIIELINALSHLIGSDTWLTQLKLKDGRMQIQGQSPTAEVLIGVLEKSPLFSHVRFVSPLTQDKRTGLERFQISMDAGVKGETGEQ